MPVPPFTYVANEDLRPGRGTQPPPGSGGATGAEVVVVGSDRYTLELDATPHATLTRNGAGGLTGFDNGSLTASLGGGQLVDAGSDAAGGAAINWGRWNGPGSTILQRFPGGSTVSNDGGNLHYVYGAVATDLPSSGQVFYGLAGGTRPTDSTSGTTGALVSGGSVAVDFTAARMSLSGLAVGFTNATYTLSGSASLVGGLFSTSPVGGNAACTGAACKPLQAGNFAGFLAGPGGAGLGLDYFFNIPGGVIEGVGGIPQMPDAAEVLSFSASAVADPSQSAGSSACSYASQRSRNTAHSRASAGSAPSSTNSVARLGEAPRAIQRQGVVPARQPRAQRFVGVEAERLEDGHRRCAPAHAHPVDLAAHELRHRAPRVLADQDAHAVELGELLEARREVHGVAHHRVRLAELRSHVADVHRAGVDADADR